MLLVHFFLLIYIGSQPEPNSEVSDKAAAVMNRIGTGLLKQIKSDKLSHRKDILSVLAQANTMEDEAHQMKDEDVLSRAYNLKPPFYFGLDELYSFIFRNPYFPHRWS